jgi:hypothetical protein
MCCHSSSGRCNTHAITTCAAGCQGAFLHSAHLRHVSKLCHQAPRLLSSTPNLLGAAGLQVEQAVSGRKEVLDRLPLRHSLHRVRQAGRHTQLVEQSTTSHPKRLQQGQLHALCSGLLQVALINQVCAVACATSATKDPHRPSPVS